MSLQPLTTWWPDANQTRNFQLRYLKRRIKRYQRATVKYLRSQYYLSSALSDVQRAFRFNEDIALGGLLIVGGLSFAAISIFANALYYFVMAASILSVTSGINIAATVGVAIAVISVLSIWLGAFVQNIWMHALYEGSTRKQHKSLRMTVKRSLRHATRTAVAWWCLLLAAVAPGAILNMVLLAIIKLFHLKLAVVLPYMLALGGAALVWAVWVLVNYSLLPQVALFGRQASWKDAVLQAQQLVNRKGRVFILSNYAACVVGLGMAYLIAWGIQFATHTALMLSFALLSVVPLSIMNASLTMLYRKRRLARS